LRHLRQHPRGSLDPLFQSIQAPEFTAQTLDFNRRQTPEAQRIDVTFERFFGGNAAG